MMIANVWISVSFSQTSPVLELGLLFESEVKEVSPFGSVLFVGLELKLDNLYRYQNGSHHAVFCVVFHLVNLALKLSQCTALTQPRNNFKLYDRMFWSLRLRATHWGVYVIAMSDYQKQTL